MLTIKENKPVHFDKAKNYIADNQNVIKISSPEFLIREQEIDNYLSRFSERPNLYAVFIKKTKKTNWCLKYIGQRESTGIKQRLREHLIKCNVNTGSQLDKVNYALKTGFEIGLILISIMPDSNKQEHYRLLYESMLIYEFRKILEWNKQKKKIMTSS